MQDATGTNGLFLKVGLDTCDGDVTPPSRDRRPRYYLPECTDTTIAGSAVFATAGVVFQSIASQAAYGADLIARAEAAWNRANTTTSNFSRFQTQCDDGDIKSGDVDADSRGQIAGAVQAAVALYEATGKSDYKTFVETHYTRVPPYSDSWWGPYWSTNQDGSVWDHARTSLYGPACDWRNEQQLFRLGCRHRQSAAAEGVSGLERPLAREFLGGTKPVAQATWMQRHSGVWLTD